MKSRDIFHFSDDTSIAVYAAQRHAITWTNTGVLLTGLLRTNFNENMKTPVVSIRGARPQGVPKVWVVDPDIL